MGEQKESVRYLTWRVDGGFITNLAREKCYVEHDIQAALRILTGCMQSDELSEEEIIGMAMKILDGKAELKGVFPDDDYGYRELDKPDERYNLSNLIFIKDENKKLEQEVNDLSSKLAFIYKNCDSHILRELDKQYVEEYDEYLIPAGVRRDKGFDRVSTGSKMLDSYLKRQKMDTEDDYGWLEPSGKYHPVEWGDHQEWANNYILQLCNDGVMNPDEAPTDCGQYLVSKGWILLHNPAQGIPIMTKDDINRMTKSQKEFLYDYYIERDCHKEANAIWSEE